MTQARYLRAPTRDKRIARGDDFAADAWTDTSTGETVYTVVGVDRNQLYREKCQDGRRCLHGCHHTDRCHSETMRALISASS